jgi:HK97 gp10 family phage protein
MPKVVVTGIPEIDRKLKKLAPAVQRKVVRKAMRSGMKLVLVEAQVNVPVLSGLTKENLEIHQAKPKRGQMTMLVRVKKNEGFIKTSKKGERAFYPADVEFGHGGPRPAEPHPFMRPAYDTMGPAARDQTLTELLDGTMAEVKRS